MARERYTRREVLEIAAKGAKVVGLLAAAEVVAGCDDLTRIPTILWPTRTRTPGPTDAPTEAPKNTPTKKVTPRSTETLAPNEVALDSAVINPKLLEDGFGHIGGAEVILPPSGADSAIGGGAEQQTVDQLVARTNKNWDLYINSFKFEDLGSISQDGNLKRLITAISAGAGFDRTTYNLAERFPALKDAEGTPLRLLPFQILKVGTGSGVEEIDGWPQGNVIRDGTNITIVGQYIDDKNKDQYVLSYTEYFKRSEDDRDDVPNVPRFNWLIVDRDQFEKLVGEANKDLPKGTSGLALVGDEVAFTDGKTNYSWEINTISPEIVKAVKDSAGFMRVDMIGDQLAEKPIVPVPVGLDLPQEYETSYDQETGVVSVYFKENGVLSEKPKLTASYNAENKTWEWAKVKEPIVAPVVEGLVSKEVDGQTLYFAEAGNPYGLEENQYAGRIKTNVSLEGEETGAMFLVPGAAEKFLLEELAKITEGPKLRFAIPIDPLNEEPINLSFYVGYAGSTVRMLKIDFSGEAILSSIFPEVESIFTGLTIVGDQRYGNSWLLLDKRYASLDDNTAMKHLNVVGGGLGLEVQKTLQNVSFGDILSKNATGPIYIAATSSNDSVVITSDHILKIQNLPVFIEETSN